MKKVFGIVIAVGMVLAAYGAVTIQAAEGACSIENSLIVGSSIYGMNCLDESGWHGYTEADSSLPFKYAQEFALCPDNSIAALHALGLAVFDGTVWKEHTPGSWFLGNTIACGSGGQLWIGHIDGVSYYDGSNWIDYPLDQFGTSGNIFSVDKISVGADGSVWALTGGSVSRYSDGQWQVFEYGSGLDTDLFLSDLAVDAEGNPWVIYTSGLMHYDGSAWQHYEQMSVLQSIAIAGENRVWVGTYSDGVMLFDGSVWQSYNSESSGIATGSVNAISVDRQGRVWVGTSWGLSVFDGETWQTFLMQNSGIVDNSIGALAVLGDGPPLPEAQDHQPGSVVGNIKLGPDPLPGMQVELCAGTPPAIFYGATPCADRPGSFLVTTGDDGSFSFEGVPIGRYELAVETPDGWVYFIGTNTKITVAEGQQTDLGDVGIEQ